MAEQVVQVELGAVGPLKTVVAATMHTRHVLGQSQKLRLTVAMIGRFGPCRKRLASYLAELAALVGSVVGLAVKVPQLEHHGWHESGHHMGRDYT